MESEFSREGDLRLVRESGETSHREVGMEEEPEVGLRSVGRSKQGQGLCQSGK